MKELQTAKPQEFTYRAAGATSVALVGDFTNWQEKPIAMKPAGAGIWKVSVPLAPGTHHYKFMVDGEWRDDPECTLRVPNPFGTENAVRRVV